MPGPYINQAPVDDDGEMRSESDRPQGTDPQTMAILSRILALLEAQTQIPPPEGMMPGANPMGMPGMEMGMPPPDMGMGGPPPPPGGPGMPPPMPAPGMGMEMGPPPGMPPMGMPPPPPGGDMPFTQYAQQRMGRM